MTNTKTMRTVISMIIAVVLGVTMFTFKYKVKNLENELTTINRQISEDTKAVHILKAEWSHLNSPERLRELNSRISSLSPVKAQQIIDYANLPFDYDDNTDAKRIIAQNRIYSTAARNKKIKQLVSIHSN